VEEAPPYWHSKLALQTELKALETSAMHKISSRFLPILAVIAVPLALAPVVHAQIQGSVTRITPVPDGASFNVDGQLYTHAVSAVWPAGSKHLLYVDP